MESGENQQNEVQVLGTALFAAGILNDRTSGKPTLMGSFSFFPTIVHKQ